MEHLSEQAFVYKICVIGDAEVGKSSTVIRWSKGWFHHDYQLTVGVQHYARNIEIGDPFEPIKIKLVIWDMAGQQWFKKIRENFYDGAKGIVLMYDISRRKTYDALPEWHKEALENIGHRVPLIIVGNKSDLRPYYIKRKEVEEYSKGLGAPYIITSAKTGSRVADLFQIIGEIVHEESKAKVPGGMDWSDKK